MDNLTAEQMLEEVSKEMTPEELGTSQETVEQAKSEPSPAAPVEPELWEYQAAGKLIREPKDMVLKRASYGYNYAQEMEKINRERADIQKIREENAALQKWKQYDDYARSNKEWASHVYNMWQNRTQYSTPGVDPDNPLVQQITNMQRAFEEKLASLEPKLSQFDQFIHSQNIAKEESVLDGEINSVRSEWADKGVDFDQRDEQGKSLQTRILEHMRDNHIPSFRAGFRDFYFDTIVTRERERSKEEHAKELQKRQKQGLLGISSTPQAHAPSNGSVRSRSYDDLSELAKKELGLT